MYRRYRLLTSLAHSLAGRLSRREAEDGPGNWDLLVLDFDCLLLVIGTICVYYLFPCSTVSFGVELSVSRLTYVSLFKLYFTRFVSVPSKSFERTFCVFCTCLPFYEGRTHPTQL